MTTPAPDDRRVLMDVQNTLSLPRTPKTSRQTTGRRILPKTRQPVISPLSSPASPMANLKLLTKVASVMSENPPTTEKYSRRLRSLSFICNKFLEIYRWNMPVGKSETISLVGLADRLGIKKRRVYDVINVVSSLSLAVKVCKDRYCWFGAQNLGSSLANLKAYALLNNFHIQLKELLESSPELNWTSGKRSRNPKTECEAPKNQFLKESEPCNLTPFDHNRIGVLCQKFLMLFLVAEDGVPLSLPLLSTLILTSDIQFKTGVRRLYDVANALEAFGLIAKSDELTARRPAFVYKGPIVQPSSSVTKLNVECVCENSADAVDSGLDNSLDVSVDGMLEAESKLDTPKPDRVGVEDSPPAKKRLVFSTDCSPTVEEKTSEGPPAVTKLRLKDVKPVLLSSSSRLLGDEEAAYYRSKINSQCPTFLIVRAPNPPGSAIRLK